MAVETAIRIVRLAREVGFCFGVKRAINMTRAALDVRPTVSILGELVHNKRVTDELEAKGLEKVSDVAAAPKGTMVVRAHGIPRATMREAVDRGLDIVDATCPIVLKAQQAAVTLEQRGCQVVIIGDRNHAEIKGIIGALESDPLVIDSITELHEAQRTGVLRRKVGVIFQTTHALELCNALLNEMVMQCREVQVINTICRPVQKRQDDAIGLAESVDLMLVVGSRGSANTVELAGLCRHHNAYTVQIEGAHELTAELYDWAEEIGIASGLSTPEDLVEGVRTAILDCPSPIRPGNRPSAGSLSDLLNLAPAL